VEKTTKFVEATTPKWKKINPKVKSLKIAIMGCVVNGPGESKHADIGISLPGNGEAPAAPVFIDGEKRLTLRGDGIATEFHQIVENYIENRFGAGTPATTSTA
jgi:(E)-4-hydroxy-3-methylbut-2-enyl-diphosphate synthase